MLHDMMPRFELFQPDSLQNALELAKRLENRAWLVAGG
jgi:CO/xanthine dehydrogenase FAD-binding subunit